MGRLAPDYIVQDGVVPRAALPAVLDRIEQLSAEAGLRVATSSTLGDGNPPPARAVRHVSDDGAEQAAEKLAEEIVTCCLGSAVPSPASTVWASTRRA